MKACFANQAQFSNNSRAYAYAGEALCTVRLNYLSSIRHPSYPNYPMASEVTVARSGKKSGKTDSRPVIIFCALSACVILTAAALAVGVAFMI